MPAGLIFSYMFIFAHLFCGLLLGLGFYHLTHDRRAIPLCIVSSLIPDIIDKPLGLLIPALGSGRTIFHTLLVVLIVAIIALVILRKRYMLSGIAVACCIFVHQVLDAMWQLPAIWTYPFSGPFPLYNPPDYLGHSLWLEITTPSEWIFLMATVVMMLRIFSTRHDVPEGGHSFRVVTIMLLAGLGIFMAGAGIFGAYNTFLAPAYSQVTTSMAGILALAGAAVMSQWHRSDPRL